MRLGAVVVLHDAWPAGDKTVHALLAGTRTPDRVVVVDQVAEDGSAAAVRALFPYFDVIVATAGRAWAAAANLGCERLLARGVEAVLVITADCIPALGAVAALEARLEEVPGVGVVGPLLVPAWAPLEVLSAGGSLDPRSRDPVHHREPGLVEDWEGAEPVSREWLDGAFLLVRADALREVGPFDEEYLQSFAFAPVDHHLRMGAHGWGVECVPVAVATRERGPLDAEVGAGDRLRFLTRHAPRPQVARELARQAREAARDLGRGDAEQAAGRARAAARLLSRRRGPLSRG
jgi:GT2 family glycosyltransferase